MRDLFHTFSIRKAPFRRVGGGGGGAFPLQGSPGVQRPIHISVFQGFSRECKAVCIYGTGFPPGGATCCVGFPRTPIPTTGLCQEVNGLEISIALER